MPKSYWRIAPVLFVFVVLLALTSTVIAQGSIPPPVQLPRDKIFPGTVVVGAPVVPTGREVDTAPALDRNDKAETVILRADGTKERVLHSPLVDPKSLLLPGDTLLASIPPRSLAPKRGK